jgi:DNA-binding GntR family transcriptional regulator
VGTRWFRISALRRTNSSPEPLGWTDIYLLPRYSKVVDAVDHAQTHVYQQVERMFGEPTVRARFEIFASRIPTRLARPLKVASGTPALTFVRRYFGASGENFENSVTVHPELRFTYTMDVQREPRKPRRT